MPVPNYDNTLIGEYIRQIENPDSVGFDRRNRTWTNPRLDPKVKGHESDYDKNNRGFGIDIVNNPHAKAIASKNREKGLTEQEERALRNNHIHYVSSLINKHSKAIPASKNMSERMRMLAIGYLYRGNDSKHGYNIWNDNNPIGNAYTKGDEEGFEDALYRYYEKNDLSERAGNSLNFLDKHEREIAEQQKRRRLQGTGKLIERPKESLQTNVLKGVEQRVKAAEQWADGWKERAGIKAEGGPLQEQQRLASWDELPLNERAAYIGAAVRNGIATLPEIRLKYKEFAEGGALSTGSIDEIQETDEANRAYGTNVSLAHIPNTYGDGGSLYGEGEDTRQRQILERAESKVRDREIYNNYRDAVDVTPAANRALADIGNHLFIKYSKHIA